MSGKPFQTESRLGKKVNDIPAPDGVRSGHFSLPPNYGGTRYGGFCADEAAEQRRKETEKAVGNGLDNISGQDEKYRDHLRKTDFRTYEPKPPSKLPAVSNEENLRPKGIYKMLKCLENGDFSTDDLLLGSLILLMLGSNSDDDMILVLVLTALL